MRYYVICKDFSHNGEKIYINFSNPQPAIRSEIPSPFYEVTCSSGSRNTYTKNEIKAEVGFEPIIGGIVGGLLFLVDPLLGAMGTGLGLFGIAAEEEKKVRKFNESWG
jgi:hypothetical protein